MDPGPGSDAPSGAALPQGLSTP